jgi:perosamine synthetase
VNEMKPIVDEVSLPSDQDASGRTLGREEMAMLEEVIASGILTCTKGTKVKALEKAFADMLGVKYAFACASGTAAIHCAVAAIDPEPGDEIVTTSVTDMGAITPILYQAAIPVFADVDPVTLNVTAKTIEAALSDRTKAILVTHLFGNPAEMKAIVALAEARGIPIIEDCAQAFLATCDGRNVGTFGAVGCFSFQQGKHITAGEGGLVVSNDDAVGRRLRLFIDKAWGYGDPKPDHYFLALNYRMTELQGAVVLAQLAKLKSGVDQRVKMAARLNDALDGLEGLTLPRPAEGSSHVYWRYCPMVDTDRIAGGPVALGGALKQFSIASGPRYIQKPAFQCEVLQKQRTFGNSRFPFNLARPEAVDYSPERFPGTFKALEQVLVLPWNERYQSHHIDYIAHAIRTQFKSLTGN